MIWVVLVCTAVWIYLLTVLERAKLSFFKFLVGSVGIFILMMVTLQPIVTVPLQKIVAASMGVLGNLTKMFYSYYQYSLIFIQRANEAISLYIDYECSGVIEIFAYISLLAFFPLYNFGEKIVAGAIGVIWVFASNILRLLVICILIYFFGNDIYFFAHAIFGRIIFYGLTITLYFNVFTKAQILRQKVGKFSYEEPSE